MVLFRLLLALLTVVRTVLPFLSELNIDYKNLPVNFSVERVSDVYLPDNSDVREYPTILRLEHQSNPEDNGKLFVTFEKWNDTYPVYESCDDGKSWNYISKVKDEFNRNYYNEWMPFLYELPADIGEFSKGTIILAATSIYGRGVTDSTITLYSSTDLGRTFSAFCNVDKAGGTDWGVWEPYLIYEEETGRLFCFYSDDSDPRHSQKLVYKYTTDMIHWSKKKDCVACDDLYLRPGMVSVAKMGNGEYFMVYEMVGLDAQPVYCKKSRSLDDWGDVSDYGRKISAAGKALGSSPFAAWTPSGGSCGTLIVTAHHHADGRSRTGTDMFLSFDYGKTFVPVDNPIPYSSGVDRCGYSPSLFVSSEDGAVYYANNPSDDGYKITMAKIVIKEK